MDVAVCVGLAFTAPAWGMFLIIFMRNRLKTEIDPEVLELAAQMSG